MMKPDAMMWYICFFVLLVISFASGQSIIAVDVGTEFFKVVLVQRTCVLSLEVEEGGKKEKTNDLFVVK